MIFWYIWTNSTDYVYLNYNAFDVYFPVDKTVAGLCSRGGGGIAFDVLLCLAQARQGLAWRYDPINPFRTAVPFWGQASQIPSSLSPIVPETRLQS